MPRALALVNPRASRGSALARYAAVRRDVEAGFAVDEVLLDDGGRWHDAVERAQRDGVERVIAVGGDGTVHAVANALLWSRAPVALAAIGVGSSNDFHKPVRRRARGIPIRVGAPLPRDVGLARWVDDRGITHARWFVVSASIGLVARANRRFCTSAVAAWLGARSVDAAIACAAAGALVAHEDVAARISTLGEVALSNVSVMLTPFLAGSFRHAKGPQPGDGRFAVHLCGGLSRAELLGTLLRLFSGRRTPSVRSWQAGAVEMELEREDDLELDGEVFRARKVKLEVIRDALEVCT